MEWRQRLKEIEEVLLAYEAIAPAKKTDRSLPWKKRDVEKEGDQ